MPSWFIKFCEVKHMQVLSGKTSRTDASLQISKVSLTGRASLKDQLGIWLSLSGNSDQSLDLKSMCSKNNLCSDLSMSLKPLVEEECVESMRRYE